jgi:hypothetical protein
VVDARPISLMTCLGWIAVVVTALLAPSVRARADGSNATVALVVPAEIHGRLAEELRRELEASQFSVLSLPAATAADPSATARALLGAGPERADAGETPAASIGGRLIAVVAADQRQITIYAHGPGAPEALTTTSLTVEQDDRPGRRRLCLAVVEHLRRIALAPSPTAAREVVAPAQADGAKPAAAPAIPAPAVNPPAVGEAARRPWWFGVASDLNILSARGTPTAHVTLMAEHPLGGRLTLAARAAWPVLGTQFTDQDRFVRTWTFAADTGVQVRLRDPEARLRPTVGAALGLRFALADTDEAEMRASRIEMTPAATLAINAGLRYRIRPLVDLIFATDLSQGLLLLTDRRDYEKAAARERLVRLSLGVLFEY